MLSHEDLETYYRINFALMQYHKYSLSDIENMIPWEREIYLALLENHIREEEEKSLTIYEPDQNHMEAALKRVMAAQEIERLVVQIRECLVYSAPPEMGALYSSVNSMREKIEEEQTQARLKQEAIKRQELWQRKEEERNFQLKMAYLVATSIFLLYLWLWLLFVSQLGKK